MMCDAGIAKFIIISHLDKIYMEEGDCGEKNLTALLSEL